MDNREYAREYYHSHKEKHKEYHKKWYEKNKEYARAYQKRWQQKNKIAKGIYRTNATYNKQVLYSVWNNETDEVVIIDGTMPECAKTMGISPKSLPAIMTRARQGKSNKWTFEKRSIREICNERE